jgi:hypothetical protein
LGKNIKKWAFSHIKKFYPVSAIWPKQSYAADFCKSQAITIENMVLRIILPFPF